MNEQEKREKVIEALELCTSKIETRTQIPCETCPYHNRKYHGVLGDGCSYSGRPIFMKESLREIMGDDFRQEFPW